MKIWAVFSKVGDIFKYLLTGRKRKLYKQWVEMAELPPEEISREEDGSRIIREEEEKYDATLQLARLYMMQGASLVLLCVILILLLIRSC